MATDVNILNGKTTSTYLPTIDYYTTTEAQKLNYFISLGAYYVVFVTIIGLLIIISLAIFFACKHKFCCKCKPTSDRLEVVPPPNESQSIVGKTMTDIEYWREVL